MVVNFWRKQSVELHDVLHGFRAGRGTGTTTLEEKLMQQFSGITHEPLFQILLDVRKAYGSLDRGRCMDILWGYEMGMKMARLLVHHWDNQQTVPKAVRFLRKAFGTGKGGNARRTRLPHDIQYCIGCGGDGGVIRSFWVTGGAAWFGLVSGRTEADFLHKL